MYYGLLEISVIGMLHIARLSGRTVQAFSLSPISARSRILPTLPGRSALFSTSTSDDDESVRRYVVIHKNNQSMNFRNGSPLVFSGSVEKTIQIGTDDDADESKIPMGSLVGIVVSNEKSERPAKRGGGGRGKGKAQKETKIDYKHYVVDKEDDITEEYDSKGEYLSTIEDTSQLPLAIEQGKLIGFGFFNPVSMYRAFIFCHEANYKELFKEISVMFKTSTGSNKEKTEKVIEMVMKAKIQDAIRSRLLLNLPSSSTDSYRLVNGEGDGLSGMAVDILGGKVAVVMASASWVEIYKETIMKVMRQVLDSHPIYGADEESNLDIVWRNTPMRLKQDGYEFPEEDEAQKEDEDSTPVILTENKIKYYTYPFDLSSQKTGFYCDQRENRYNLAMNCKDKNVLDLCCYNGGFALNAMIHGGAKSCIGVDSSQDAVDGASENAKLNGLDSDSVQFVKKDIVDFMKDATDEGKEFDVIILDPPKLAPTVTALERATRKYHSLNRDAIRLINSKEGGLLLTCTCSGAMTQKNGGQYFLETIKGAALAAGRRITLLRSSGAAPCHTQCPASFPANAYLTAALFYISPESED